MSTDAEAATKEAQLSETSLGPNDASPKRGRRWLKIVAWVVVLGLVFGVLLPQVIDYDQVWEAIRGLAWWEIVVLAAVGLARIPTEGLVYKALLPALRLRDAMRTWLIVTGGTTFLPPPADAAVFYALTRSAGVKSRPAMTAAMLTFLYPTVGRLLLPLVAIVPFVIFAAVDDETLPIFLVTLAIAAVVALFAHLVARSQESALRLGDWASRMLSRLLIRLHRDPVDSLGPAVVRFRTDTLASVRGNWKLAVLAVGSNFLIIYMILLLSLRFIGLSNGELPWVEILAAFALSQWAQTMMPLSPGGLGIADAVLLSCLAAIDPGNADAIVAALVLWRVFYWALPIPVGLVAIQGWKRENPNAMQEAMAVFGRSKRGNGEETPPEPG